MAKISGLTAAVLIVLALVLGGLIVYFMFPQEVEVVKDRVVVKEKIVNNEITIPVDVDATYLDPAIDEMLSSDELETDCGNDEYDAEQIQIKDIKTWSVEFKDEDYKVNSELKLKYLDTDTNEKCYKTCELEVEYEQDEKPVVSIDC